MAFDKDLHHRKSIRLRGYDYSQPGAYFITICTHQRQQLFGAIVDGAMILNAAGMLADSMWRELAEHYPSVALGDHIVMPNHLHGIVHVGAPLAAPHYGLAYSCDIALRNYTATHNAVNRMNDATEQGAASSVPTLGKILRRYKSISATAINRHLNRQSLPMWQRNYYEHIIRNESAYQNISEYIRNNPQQWQNDPYR